MYIADVFKLANIITVDVLKYVSFGKVYKSEIHKPEIKKWNYLWTNSIVNLATNMITKLSQSNLFKILQLDKNIKLTQRAIFLVQSSE